MPGSVAKKSATKAAIRSDDDTTASKPKRISVSSSLIHQGSYKFYVLSMYIDDLAHVCKVSRRDEDPILGFQRLLDEKRADDIAEYIEQGRGTIPNAVILSAQANANLVYTREKRSIAFDKVPAAFLVLDGQHRVFGYSKVRTDKRLRVPVVIYHGLTLEQEVNIFIDINTKQRPVSNELLLDIKSLANRETDIESMSNELFELFSEEPTSALLGYLNPNPSRKVPGKISRSTFHMATKPLATVFIENNAPVETCYQILNAYISAFMSGLKAKGQAETIKNHIVFRAIIALFDEVTQKTQDKYEDDLNMDNFFEVISPIFEKQKEKGIDFSSPGSSYIAFSEKLSKGLKRRLTLHLK